MTMWNQHPHTLTATGPLASSSKSPVLVILPPSHQCPDLKRVLSLARKAFEDVTLNLLDLNLRFTWVSGDELQAAGEPAAQEMLTAAARAAQVEPPATARGMPRSANAAHRPELMQQHPNSTSTFPDADPSAPLRLIIGNLRPDLTKDQLLTRLIPPNIRPTGFTLQPKLFQLRQRPEQFRNVIVQFASERDMLATDKWVRSQSIAGGRVANLLVPNTKITCDFSRKWVAGLAVAAGKPVHVPSVDVISDHSASSTRHAFRPFDVRSEASETSRSSFSQAASSHSPSMPFPATSPTPSADEHPSAPDRLQSQSLSASSLSSPHSTHQKQHAVSVYGIDSTQPVAAVFNSILGSLSAGSVEPVRMGVRHANGRRGVEFTFDSEAEAEQFARQVWEGIEVGKYAEVTAEGEELRCG